MREEFVDNGCKCTITIGGLISQLEEFTEIKELNKYRITEDFKKNGKCSYIIHNLVGETIDTGFGVLVIFDDLEHKMGQGYKVLKVIGVGSIIDVHHIMDNCGNWQADLLFKDGTICIERI